MKGYYTNVFFTFLILKSGNMQPHSGGHTGGAVVEQVDRCPGVYMNLVWFTCASSLLRFTYFWLLQIIIASIPWPLYLCLSKKSKILKSHLFRIISIAAHFSSRPYIYEGTNQLSEKTSNADLCIWSLNRETLRKPIHFFVYRYRPRIIQVN